MRLKLRIFVHSVYFYISSLIILFISWRNPGLFIQTFISEDATRSVLSLQTIVAKEYLFFIWGVRSTFLASRIQLTKSFLQTIVAKVLFSLFERRVPHFPATEIRHCSVDKIIFTDYSRKRISFLCLRKEFDTFRQQKLYIVQ